MKFTVNQSALPVAILLLCLSGCAPGEMATKDAIKRRLKDPSSVQFEEFRAVQDGKIGCIKVNSKNSFGGYTGYSLMAVDLDSSNPSVIEERAVYSWELCGTDAESDKAYARLQCIRILYRIDLWKESSTQPGKTDAEKRQYEQWLEQDSVASKKWCEQLPSPT